MIFFLHIKMFDNVEKHIIKNYFDIWYNEMLLDRVDSQGMSTRMFNKMMKKEQKKNRNNAYLISYDYEGEP